MSKRVLTIVLGVAALAALVAGCGGGDDSSSSSDALSKSEFIKQADAICADGEKQVNEEIEELAEENGIEDQDFSKAEQEEILTQISAPGVSRQIGEVAELGAPAGDEKTIEELVSTVEDEVAELEDDPGALLSGENPLEEGSKLARDYGLKECGS